MASTPHFTIAALVAALVAVAATTAAIELTIVHDSQFYVPASANGVPALAEGAGEQFDYDKESKIAYVVGETALVNVIDYADLAAPKLLETFSIPATGTDIEVCKGVVAIGMEGENGKLDLGKIEFYSAHGTAGQGTTKLYEVTPGYLPDMIHFSKDCKMMVIANEGEAGVGADGTLNNPPGGVTVLKWADGNLTKVPTKFDLNFDAFSGDELFKRDGTGVLWSYRPDNSMEEGQDSFQQDLEPEYVAILEDNSMAYVILQENNAVAFVSLGDTPKVEAIAPLGLKSWKKLKLDASDRDGAINMVSGYEIYGAYQPDTIKAFSAGGRNYMVTANEGDAKEYLNADESQYWIEEMRGKSFSSSMNFSDTVSADLIAQLGDNARLGRLKFLNRHGLDESGAAMKLIAMGGRGVTIFEMTDDFQAVVAWDSGDEIEAKHMEMDPNGTKAIFNPVQVDAGDQLVTDGADGRSDDKGVETETVELGKCGGAHLLFVGNERSSTLTIYDITAFPGAPPKMIDQFAMANPTGNTNATWDELFASRQVGIVDPESMKWVQINDNEGQLLVAGAVSGTISAYKISCGGDSDGTGSDDGDDTGRDDSAPSLGNMNLASLVVNLVLAVLCLFINA